MTDESSTVSAFLGTPVDVDEHIKLLFKRPIDTNTHTNTHAPHTNYASFIISMSRVNYSFGTCKQLSMCFFLQRIFAFITTLGAPHFALAEIQIQIGRLLCNCNHSPVLSFTSSKWRLLRSKVKSMNAHGLANIFLFIPFHSNKSIFLRLVRSHTHTHTHACSGQFRLDYICLFFSVVAAALLCLYVRVKGCASACARYE